MAAVGCATDHRRGGGAAVDIRGDSPEEAADEVATAACDWSARCGEVSIECGGSSAGDTSCTGTIQEVTWASCYEDTHPEILADLRCADLTEEEAAQVNACVNGVISQDCVTMAQLQEHLDRVEAGEEPPPLLELPPECEALAGLFAGCPDP